MARGPPRAPSATLVGMAYPKGHGLLRKLDLKCPEVVLKEPKYWNPDFCRLFLEKWSAVDLADGAAGRRLLEVGFELLEKVNPPEDRPVLRARALAILGNAQRSAGCLQEAEESFARADSSDIPRFDRADLCRRLAYLRRDQDRWPEALELAGEARELFAAEKDEHGAGRALIIEAQVLMYLGRPRESTEAFRQALTRLDYRKGPHAYFAAVHGLGVNLVETGAAEPRQVIRTVREEFRKLRKTRISRTGERLPAGSLPCLKLRWLEALAWRQAACTRQSERLLWRVRDGLLAHDPPQPRDVAFLSVELSFELLEDGRWAEIERLAAEAVALLGGTATPALAALELWHRAALARTLTETTLATVRSAFLPLPRRSNDD